MSKERRRRRAEREREQAIQSAARAADAERRERRAARRRALARKVGLDTGLVPRPYSTSGGRRGRQSGLLAQRRRQELSITLCLLAAFNIVVWISRHDWGSRAGALAVSLLVAPVVHVLLHQRR